MCSTPSGRLMHGLNAALQTHVMSCTIGRSSNGSVGSPRCHCLDFDLGVRTVSIMWATSVAVPRNARVAFLSSNSVQAGQRQKTPTCRPVSTCRDHLQE